MKRFLSIILCAMMLLCAVAVPMSAVAEDVMAPSDIAKVLIYTDGGVSIPSDKSKVDCEIYIVDKEGGIYDTVHGINCTVNVRGNSTSSANKKPYNIKFDSKTDVLGMGKNKKWSLLANCYDKTLIRNAVVMDFAKELGVPYTPDYRYVDVYVNDVLNGSYLIIDSIEVGETRVDIDVDNNEYLLELDYNTPDEDCYYFYTGYYDTKFCINEPEIEDLTTTQTDYVEDLIYKAERALVSGDYDKVQQYFDIESMAKFYLTLEFFRNIDVATSSTRFHIKGGKIYGGPVWDFDLSSGNYNLNYYGSGMASQALHATKMKWFGALVGYSEFQSLVEEYFLDMQDIIVNLYTDNLLGLNKIDSMIAENKASFDRNHNEAGWDPGVVHHYSLQLERDPDPTYEANVAFYRNWLLERNEWLIEEWGLTDTVPSLKSSASVDLDGAFIKGMSDDTSVSSLKSNFRNTVSVYYDGTALSSSAYVPNGSTVSLGGASYMILLRGDVEEDGVIDEYDYIALKRAYLKTLAVDYSETLAADANCNGEIDVLDYVMVKRHVMGTYVIDNN